MRFGLRRSAGVPEALRRALAPEERLLAVAQADDGRADADGGHTVVAATRFGLWTVRDGVATRIDWHRVTRARLHGGVLHLAVGDEVGAWPDGTTLLRDRPEVVVRLLRSTRLTDVVHDRVRASVKASQQVSCPGASGWVALRKVAGRDGLTVQVRLDAGAEPGVDGFAEAVAAVVDELWPADTPRGGRWSDDGE